MVKNVDFCMMDLVIKVMTKKEIIKIEEIEVIEKKEEVIEA